MSKIEINDEVMVNVIVKNTVSPNRLADDLRQITYASEKIILPIDPDVQVNELTFHHTPSQQILASGTQKSNLARKVLSERDDAIDDACKELMDAGISQDDITIQHHPSGKVAIAVMDVVKYVFQVTFDEGDSLT